MKEIVQLIDEFTSKCHAHYTVCVFALSGLRRQVQHVTRHGFTKKNRIMVGNGHPNTTTPTSWVFTHEFVENSQKNGKYEDNLYKSYLVSIFSDWDEYFRPKIARILKAKQQEVMCDLMGDLRNIRNIIVHKKSVIPKNPPELKSLRWSISPGELLITEDMFRIFIEDINKMSVYRRNEDGSNFST